MDIKTSIRFTYTNSHRDRCSTVRRGQTHLRRSVTSTPNVPPTEGPLLFQHHSDSETIASEVPRMVERGEVSVQVVEVLSQALVVSSPPPPL